MTITIAQLCDAVTAALEDATTSPVSQSYDELGESILDRPTLQVYPESGSQDPSGGTDRTTFGAGVRQTEIVIHADYYAQQRSYIGEDMKALVDGIDAITDVLEAQDRTRFGYDDSNLAFRWEWARVSFVYGDPQLPYIGARFILTFRVF